MQTPFRRGAIFLLALLAGCLPTGPVEHISIYTSCGTVVGCEGASSGAADHRKAAFYDGNGLVLSRNPGAPLHARRSLDGAPPRV